MKRNQVRLYNLIFPMWALYLLPTVYWWLILPTNFLVDSLVVYCSVRRQALENPGTIWRKSILSVWLLGFLSDLFGAGLVALIDVTLFSNPNIDLNLSTFPGVTLISIPGVLLAGFCIYWLNRFFSFNRCGLDAAAIHKLALHLALFTAPYTMLIPL